MKSTKKSRKAKSFLYEALMKRKRKRKKKRGKTLTIMIVNITKYQEKV